jgi:tetratricopeptide (TPR) repeat protein
VKTAETALEQKNYQEALSKIEQALEQDSADTGAYLLRARVLREMADKRMPFEEYKDLHRRAREAEEQALSFDSGLRDEVQATRQRVYDREFEQGQLFYNRANKQENRRRYRKAISFFGAAGIAQADSARPVLNEAFARLRMGQREKVIPILEEYVERADTASKRAYSILGQLYVAHGQSKRAVDLLDQGVQRYPSDQGLQGLRLTAYNRAGDMGKALAAYREQVEERPENANYRYNYGALLLEAERYSQAIAQLERAIEIRPDHAGSQYNLGAAYVNAALARDDSVAMLEERERPFSSSAAAGDTTTADTTASDTSPSDTTASEAARRQKQIEALVQKREELFKEAIPPLERARKMDDVPAGIRRDACRALMVAYVQTNRPNKAAQVENCTGFAQADR